MSLLTKGCYSQCGAAKGMNIRVGGGEENKYGQNAWVTSVSPLHVFYPILLCSICILQTLTSPALTSKAVLLTPCKHGQKLQFILIF